MSNKPQPFNLGKGYPIDSRILVPTSPVQVNPSPVITGYVNNPGEYITLEESDWFNVGVVRDTILPADEPTPDGQLVFISDKVYNCIQITMNCRTATGGFVVPDMLSLSIPTTKVTDVAGTSLTYNNQPRLIRHANTDAVAQDRWNQVKGFQTVRWAPPKTYMTPILGSLANSATNYNGLAFELLGVKPFYIAFMSQWNEYRMGVRDVPSVATDGNTPIYRYTCWYDIRETSLRMTLGGSG